MPTEEITSEFLTPEQFAGVQQAQETVRNASTNLQQPVPVEQLQPTIPEVPQTPAQTAPPTLPVNLAEDALIAEQQRRAQAAERNLETRDTAAFDIANAFGDLTGQSAFRSEQEEDIIAPEEKLLTTFNNRARMLAAEIGMDDTRLAAGLAEIEDQAIPMEFITGQQASVERRAQIARAFKVSELNMVNAAVQAQQGNIALAQREVDRAVNAKYGPIEEELNIRQAQLQTLTPFFDRQEKKAAAAQQNVLQIQQARIAETKRTQKDNGKLAMDYAEVASSNNQGVLAGEFASLDPASPTFQKDLSNLVSQVSDPRLKLDLALKQADLNKKRAETEALRLAAIAQSRPTAIGEDGQPLPLSEEDKAKMESADFKIDLIDGVLNSSAFNSAVGPTFLTRAGTVEGGIKGTLAATAAGAATGAGAGFLAGGIGAIPGAIFGAGAGLLGGGAFSLRGVQDAGEIDNFIGSVQQLTSGEFVDSLVNAKARGATFGALSDRERDALTAAATKIGTAEVRDDNDRVIGYDISEEAMREELKRIQSAAIKVKQELGGDFPGGFDQTEEQLLDSAFGSGSDTPSIYFN